MTPPSRPTATLRSLARSLGVHPSTVSRALNPAARHLVEPALAERIRIVADAQGFRVNPIAASLRTRRSRTVGIVLPDIANPVFGPILSGIEAVLSREGYSALVANADSNAREVRIVEGLLARRVDGLILATVQAEDELLTRCLEAGVPTVLVNRSETRERASSVVSDDRLGLRLAVEHLVSLGHRRIAHLAGPQNLSTGVLRRQGYEDAMRAAGLLPGPVLAASAYSREAGARAGFILLDDARPTAIATANDLLAIGIYDALAARGLRCPDDVSVTGHNDMPLVDMIHPPLTTIRIQQERLGSLAAGLVLSRMADPSADPTREVVTPTLVIRASTAAAYPDSALAREGEEDRVDRTSPGGRSRG